MKLMFSLILIFSATLAQAQTAQSIDLDLPVSKLTISSDPVLIRNWAMNHYSGTDLDTISNHKRNLLLTFSGADFVYLKDQNATSVTKNGNAVEWLYKDDKVEYKRTYEIQGDFVHVAVEVNFKDKAPEKANLILGSKNIKDDKAAPDRNLLYYSNGKTQRFLVKDKHDPTVVTSPVKWLSAESRYFLLSVMPEGTMPESLTIQSIGEQEAQADFQYPIQNKQLKVNFKMLFVPKELTLLRKIDPSYDTTIDLGFFSIVAYPLLWLLKFIYKYVHDYGIAIIILTIIIKIITFPLTLKSVKGMRKMAEFQPKIKALQERYKNDKEALNREMMIMMKGSGYNPMAGCFPMLIQMPVFFALYKVLYTSVDLYHEPFKLWPFALWIKDLSERDPYLITPIAMTLVMFLQQRLSPPAPGMDPAQQKVMQFMPLMFGAIMWATPSGLCVYMLVNAIFSILQQLYLNKKLGVPGHVAGVASL